MPILLLPNGVGTGTTPPVPPTPDTGDDDGVMLVTSGGVRTGRRAWEVGPDPWRDLLRFLRGLQKRADDWEVRRQIAAVEAILAADEQDVMDITGLGR